MKKFIVTLTALVGLAFAQPNNTNVDLDIIENEFYCYTEYSVPGKTVTGKDVMIKLGDLCFDGMAYLVNVKGGGITQSFSISDEGRLLPVPCGCGGEE